MNARKLRAVPLIVAFPVFLQNLDSSVLGTALPAVAFSLDVDVLHLNLAITSYLASLVLFLPASAWLADRYGARRIFCAAVLVFTLASALCGAAQSLPQLVACRLLQGVGGAMMVPVGRLILLQSVPASMMVQAMVWFTVPGAIGRLLGPLFGGAIVSFTSWRWIFLLNIPCGIAAVVLALRFIEPDAPAREDVAAAPDFAGIFLLAASLAGLLGGLELVGKHLVPGWAIVLLLAGGVLTLWLYLRRMRSQQEPLIDAAAGRFAHADGRLRGSRCQTGAANRAHVSRLSAHAHRGRLRHHLLLRQLHAAHADNAALPDRLPVRRGRRFQCHVAGHPGQHRILRHPAAPHGARDGALLDVAAAVRDARRGLGRAAAGVDARSPHGCGGGHQRAGGCGLPVRLARDVGHSDRLHPVVPADAARCA
jgi:hypothetical protein